MKGPNGQIELLTVPAEALAKAGKNKKTE